MKLNIGNNIKRLRLAKGLTQEGLAALLNVSAAAISKWEARNTYPDITTLFPLAQILGVSIDELLGYDEAATQAEIALLLEEYRRLHTQGCLDDARRLMEAARKTYPQDYAIMLKYTEQSIEDGVGGKAAEELLQLCDCILDGCIKDDIRIPAIRCKAKLLHRTGNTEDALALLSALPLPLARLYKEGLFEKVSAEFCNWNTQNCYGMMEQAALRQARRIRYDPTMQTDEKLTRLKKLADTYMALSETEDMQMMRLAAVSVLGVATGMLTEDDISTELVLRLEDKHFAAYAALDALAKEDTVLAAMLDGLYRGDSSLAWEVRRRATSPHPHCVALRSCRGYTELLAKWEKHLIP